MLHSFGFARLPPHSELAAYGLSDIVYSTTFDEIHEYAMQAFGEEDEGGWGPCQHCGAN